jgi:hypothetical protein
MIQLKATGLSTFLDFVLAKTPLGCLSRFLGRGFAWFGGLGRTGIIHLGRGHRDAKHFTQEWGRANHLAFAKFHAGSCSGQRESVSCSSDSHVGKSAFFFQFVGIIGTTVMRKYPIFQSHQIDVRKFQSLGTV